MNINFKKILLLPSLLLAQAYLLIGVPIENLALKEIQGTNLKSQINPNENLEISESTTTQIEKIEHKNIFNVIVFLFIFAPIILNNKINPYFKINILNVLFYLFPKKFSNSLSK